MGSNRDFLIPGSIHSDPVVIRASNSSCMNTCTVYA